MEENAAHQENEQLSFATIWGSLSPAQQEVEATMSLWGGGVHDVGEKRGRFFIACARCFSLGWSGVVSPGLCAQSRVSKSVHGAFGAISGQWVVTGCA